VSAAEETAQSFVDVWAGEVRRLVPEVRDLRQRYDEYRRALDHDWTLAEHDLYRRWQRLWAAQHHLVWAAHQLESWIRRLARERRTKTPKPDAVLADLRNVLEHLDEAELDEATATRSDNPARTKSLRRLPGAQLLIGTGGNPRQLFDLIDSDEIERRALDVVTTADRLDQGPRTTSTTCWPAANGHRGIARTGRKRRDRAGHGGEPWRRKPNSVATDTIRCFLVGCGVERRVDALGILRRYELPRRHSGQARWPRRGERTSPPGCPCGQGLPVTSWRS
jgi:hypothetical protein